MNNIDDSGYLNNLSHGDIDAFDILFMRYSPIAKNFIFGFIKDDQETLDIVQDMFLKIWINRERMGGIRSFRAYLFKMSKNAIYDYFEHNKLIDKYKTNFNRECLSEDIIEEQLHAQDLELLIDMIVERMPKRQSLIFKMSRKEGLTNDQIAEKLSISKHTVENTMSLVIKQIKDVIFLALTFFIN